MVFSSSQTLIDESALFTHVAVQRVQQPSAVFIRPGSDSLLFFFALRNIWCVSERCISLPLFSPTFDLRLFLGELSPFALLPRRFQHEAWNDGLFHMKDTHTNEKDR